MVSGVPTTGKILYNYFLKILTSLDRRTLLRMRKYSKKIGYVGHGNDSIVLTSKITRLRYDHSEFVDCSNHISSRYRGNVITGDVVCEIHPMCEIEDDVIFSLAHIY